MLRCVSCNTAKIESWLSLLRGLGFRGIFMDGGVAATFGRTTETLLGLLTLCMMGCATEGRSECADIEDPGVDSIDRRRTSVARRSLSLRSVRRLTRWPFFKVPSFHFGLRETIPEERWSLLVPLASSRVARFRTFRNRREQHQL